MQAYNKYKNSNVDWLGQVPEHWEVENSKWLFALRNEKARQDDEMLTASQKYGMISQKEFMELENQNVMQVIKNADILKHIEAGDFVISMRSFQGGLEYSSLSGSVSSAYVALVPNEKVVHEFYKYLFKSPLFIQTLQSTSNLVRDGQALRYNNFIQIRLPLPPIDEQEYLAKFLKKEIARIDALIIEKQNFITLLEEKRKAMVEEAVHSGKVTNLRWKWCTKSKYRVITREAENCYQAVGLLNRGRGIFKKDIKVGAELGDSEFHTIKARDLVLSGQFAWEGAVALVGPEFDGLICSHRYHVYNGTEDVAVTEYLWAYLTTMDGDFLLNQCSRGSAGRNRPLSANLLENYTIPLPPIEVQNKIANFVLKEKKLRSEAENFKNLLLERKAALISAAVTGKIDVREAV